MTTLILTLIYPSHKFLEKKDNGKIQARFWTSVASHGRISPKSTNNVIYNSNLTSVRVRTGADPSCGDSRRPRHIELCAKLLLLLIGHRVLRKLNSTGDKWAHLPDIARWLKEDDSKIGMTLLLLTGMFKYQWAGSRIFFVLCTWQAWIWYKFSALALLIWIAHQYEDKKYKWQTSILTAAGTVCIYLRHMANGAVLKIPLYFSSR